MRKKGLARASRSRRNPTYRKVRDEWHATSRMKDSRRRRKIARSSKSESAGQNFNAENQLTVLGTLR